MDGKRYLRYYMLGNVFVRETFKPHYLQSAAYSLQSGIRYFVYDSKMNQIWQGNKHCTKEASPEKEQGLACTMAAAGLACGVRKQKCRLLVRLVQEYGVKKWAFIASLIGRRIGKQCRERWFNHLRPDIKRDAWTLDEEIALVEAHSAMGNRWAEIAKRIPGRTENSIKNHRNTTWRRQMNKRKS
ncbi:transcription factor MYB98-like [Papaver somniferum]|uniref:transcription factor MYB98-like n=1 Tax=Papaver somniferum TaxID=3469 RepID=UPI000E704A88|nr:transcription factor MYB98-like [Papaver somniferum]